MGNPSYINRLDGEGAAKVGGRWNPAFYLPYQLVVIEIDSSLCMDCTTFSPAIPEGWATKPGGEKITKDIGTAWLSEAKAPYLKVHSVHNPLEHNYLLSPKHSEFEAKIVNKHWYLYYDRLMIE